MKRLLASAAACAIIAATPPAATAQGTGGPQPVVFVHGMGTSAADIGVAQDGGEAQFGDLLQRLADAHPRPDACQDDAQPDRPWDGSPCVFRYVEDAAEATEGGAAASGPNDSQSAVRDNADKLAREIEEVSENAGGTPIVLIGYSMGGAIIRTYLATHREAAEDLIGSVVLIDAVASGSWGYAFASEVPRRVGGTLGARLSELMRTLAASSAAVDFDRPATRDLSPRSELFRTITPMELPRNVDYYTFWGDIRVVIERRLLHYELPEFALPSLGDLGLLPGDPDPTALPELGGQRFSPPTDDGHVALDIPHETRIALDASVVRDLIDSCAQKPKKNSGSVPCADLVGEHFNVPNTHTAVPTQMERIMVDVAELGGRVSLLDAVLQAVAE